MRNFIMTVVAVFCVIACTKVRMGQMVIPKSKIVCEVDWKRLPDRDLYILPGSFDIVAARVFNSEHFHWQQIDTAGSLEADTLRLDSGEYQWAIYTSDIPYYIIEKLDSFKLDRTVSLRQLCARIPRMSMKEINYAFPDFEQSLIGYCDTVKQAPRLFCGNLRSEIPVNSDSLQVNSLHFSPEMLSREVSFRVSIEAGEGVKVNRVVANIVGVPIRVELISGLLDGNRTHLGQTLFELVKDPAEPGWWSGTVRILGILPPTSPDAVSGAGMFQVYIDEGATHRKIRRIVNLTDYLSKTPLLEQTEIEDWYHGSYTPVMYRIASPIVLDASGVLAGGDAVSEWINPDDGETRDIFDGRDDDEI